MRGGTGFDGGRAPYQLSLYLRAIVADRINCLPDGSSLAPVACLKKVSSWIAAWHTARELSTRAASPTNMAICAIIVRRCAAGADMGEEPRHPGNLAVDPRNLSGDLGLCSAVRRRSAWLSGDATYCHTTYSV